MLFYEIRKIKIIIPLNELIENQSYVHINIKMFNIILHFQEDYNNPKG